jgi:hypothetical protein
LESFSTVGASQGTAARAPIADVRDEQFEQVRRDLVDVSYCEGFRMPAFA